MWLEKNQQYQKMKSDKKNCCKNGSNIEVKPMSKFVLLPLTIILSPILLIIITYHLIKYKTIELNKIINFLNKKKNGKVYL